MKTTRLGPNGPELSAVRLGCNMFGGRLDLIATRRILDAALDDAVTSVIVGATNPRQVTANATAVDWILTTDDLAELVLTPLGVPCGPGNRGRNTRPSRNDSSTICCEGAFLRGLHRMTGFRT